MSNDFDSKKFLAETAPGDFDSKKFLSETTPLQVAGPEPAKSGEMPGVGSSIAHGLGQGATLGFGDEINGGIQGLYDFATDPSAHGLEALKNAYKRNRDAFRREDNETETANPWAYGLSQLAASAPASIAAGSMKIPALLSSFGIGALSGLGTSSAQTPLGDMENAGAGGAAALLAGLGGKLLGKLGGKAASKVSGIDEAVARRAAEEAAAETASARGVSGRDAQDAYKQLEHLRELGGMKNPTPMQVVTAEDLEQELAQKAQEKLLPAAARKAASAQAYKDALAGEGQRAQASAAQRLSGQRIVDIIKPRLLRYGLPALGGAMGFGGHGGLTGAGIGALAGAGLRPMMHSLLRAASDPAIARPLASFASGALRVGSEALGRAAAPVALAAAPRLSPRMQAMIDALMKSKEPDAAQSSQGQ